MHEYRLELTIGSECIIADLNLEDAEGTASNARTMFAPLLCPEMVILEGCPPKDGATVCRNDSAFITSLTARLVLPSGAMKPS